MVNNTMTLHCTYHDALHDAHARKLCSQLLNLPLPALHYGNVYIITIMLSHLAQIYNISTYELTHCFPLPVPLRSCQALPQADVQHHPFKDGGYVGHPLFVPAHPGTTQQRWPLVSTPRGCRCCPSRNTRGGGHKLQARRLDWHLRHVMLLLQSFHPKQKLESPLCASF